LLSLAPALTYVLRIFRTFSLTQYALQLESPVVFFTSRMDPLSPVASCLAVLGAIVATLRLYNQIHEAPEDALVVCKEVEDLQNVFGQSKEVLQRRLSIGGLTQRGETAFHITTVSIYETLVKLEKILRESMVNETSNDGKKKVSRFAWLRNSAKIKKLCVRLRNLKADLTVITTSQLV